MANVTYDLLWRETMRDLLDMLELDPPQGLFSSKSDTLVMMMLRAREKEREGVFCVREFVCFRIRK